MNKLANSAAAIIAFALVTGCAGTANQSGAGINESTRDMVAVSEVRDPNQVRCRTVVKTGTRIGTKVCKTNKEWDQATRDAREATEQIQRGSLQGPGPEGG